MKTVHARPTRAAARHLIEGVLAGLVGVATAALIVVGAQAGLKGLAVIAGGLTAASVLLMMAGSPGLPNRVLTFGLAFSLSISLKVHPVFRAEHLGGAIGIRVSLTDLLLFALMALALTTVVRRGWLSIRVDPLTAWAASVYVACACLSTISSDDRALGLFQLTALVQAMALAVFFASGDWLGQARRWLLAGLMAALLVQASVAVLQSVRPGAVKLAFLGAGDYAEDTGKIGGIGTDIGATSIAGQDVFRPTGLLIHPNVLAGYFVLTLPLAFALALAAPTRAERRLAAVAGAVAVTALYLSLSRSGWIGTAVAVSTGAALAWRWRSVALTRSARTIVVAAGLVLVVGLAWKADRIYLRFTETANDAYQFRREYALTAWRMALDRPWLGVGLNTFTDHAVAYDRSGTSRLKAFPVHNAYLLELAETGFPGGLAFALAVGAMVLAAFRAARRATGDTQLVVLALAAGLLGFWVTQLSDYFYRIPIMTSLVWAHAGLAIGLARSREVAA